MIVAGGEVLEELAETSECMIRIALDHREKPGVRLMTTPVDIRRFRSGGVVGLFLEADLVDGATVTWAMEIGWAGRWTIDLSIAVNDEGGQRKLAEYPQAQFDNVPRFVSGVRETIHRVEETVAKFDFVNGHKVAQKENTTLPQVENEGREARPS